MQRARRDAASRPFAQRGDVVENPERASVRSDDDVVAVHDEVAHRRDREIVLQRQPTIAIVERNVDRFLGARKQKAGLLRILAHDVHGFVVRDAVDDRAPGLSAVVRAIRVRMQIVEALPAHGHVRGERIAMSRIDLRDAAPRSERGRRDVVPMLRAVARDPHEPVVGARPDRRAIDVRRREAVDDAAMLSVLRIARGEACQRRGLAGVRAREIRTDDRPRMAAVARREDDVEPEVKRGTVDAIPDERVRTIETIRFAIERRRDVLRLTRALVVNGRLSAVNQPRMAWVGRDVTVFFGSDRMEFAKRNRTVVAAAQHFGASALLLAAEHAIRKAIVRDHVVELRRRLVVPRTPRGAAVDRYGRTLIDAECDRLRIVRIDPHGVVVVAAGRTLDADPRGSAVERTVRRRVRGVDFIAIVRIGRDSREVFGSSAHALFIVRLRPRRAGIARAEDAAAVDLFDERVHARGIRGRNRNADAADVRG
jgi:hypothetical protein